MGGSLALRGLVSSPKGPSEHAFSGMFQLQDRREGREVIHPGAAPLHADHPHQLLERRSPFLTVVQAELCSEQRQDGRVKGQTPVQGQRPQVTARRRDKRNCILNIVSIKTDFLLVALISL